jgi:hypothetical protein
MRTISRLGTRLLLLRKWIRPSTRCIGSDDGGERRVECNVRLLLLLAFAGPLLLLLLLLLAVLAQ